MRVNSTTTGSFATSTLLSSTRLTCTDPPDGGFSAAGFVTALTILSSFKFTCYKGVKVRQTPTATSLAVVCPLVCSAAYFIKPSIFDLLPFDYESVKY